MVRSYQYLHVFAWWVLQVLKQTLAEASAFELLSPSSEQPGPSLLNPCSLAAVSYGPVGQAQPGSSEWANVRCVPTSSCPSSCHPTAETACCATG
ncbi:hypothetical protein V8C86DRAFT_2963499 [Haematococcus lacustris]